jgi:isocitrate dehydrogenase (NAD+)
MAHRLTLIPGDGIGPEISEAALEVIRACGVDIDWEVCYAGATAMESGPTPLPETVLETIRRNRVALKGPITTPVGSGFRSVNVAIRKALSLYACLRPVEAFAGVRTPWAGVDLAVVRENTEGLYSGAEHEVTSGVGVGLRLLSRYATERVVRFAFELAEREQRGRVTIVHGRGCAPKADGLFCEWAESTARDHPSVEAELMGVGECAMELARDPTRFEILVAENLFGDILSDMCAGLVGGLGLVPGANIGDRYAVFEPVHGSAPDIAGQRKANPIAIILSGALMLRHIGEQRASERIRAAVASVLESGEARTVDLGGEASTMEMTEAIIGQLPAR